MTSPLAASLFEFQGLPVPAAICERDGTLLAVNAATTRLVGRPASDIVGKKSWDFAPGIEHVWPDIIRTTRERGEFRGDITLATQRGPVAIHYLVALRTHEQKPYLILFAVPRDALIEQARHADRDIQQRTEALGLVAGGIAHDFNNQLTSVLAEASAARDSAELPTTTIDSLRRIEAAANRMAQLTRQLLAYAGRGRLVTELIDPDQLIREAQDQLTRLVRFDVELVIKLHADGAVIEADRGLLLQVLGNLVANASEAQGTDGTIQIETSRADGQRWWQLVIGDHGIGMEPETISRIWDPFFTTKSGHHGLGLSAVVGIVRRLGGEIAVESRPGDGSTFTLRLPLVDGEQPRPTMRDIPVITRPVLKGMRALIADDEPAVRTTIRRLLERREATIVTAADGTEAEARLREGGFQFVVLDVMMPGLTGYQLLPIARATNPHAPVMLMSGYTDVEHSRGGNDEPDAFLEKPFTAKGFDEAIDTLVGSRR